MRRAFCTSLLACTVVLAGSLATAAPARPKVATAKAAAAPAQPVPPVFAFSRSADGDLGTFRVDVDPAWIDGARTASLRGLDGAVFLVWPPAAFGDGPDRDANVEDMGGKRAREPGRRMTFWGRFQGAGTHPLELSWRVADDLSTRRTRTIDLVVPADAGADAGLDGEWLAAGAESLRRRFPPDTDAFLQFVLWSWSTRAAGSGPSRAWAPEWRERVRPDLLSVTTGLQAAQEAIQLDALSDPRSLDSGPATVPLKSLMGPEIASHPYTKMLKGLKPVVEPIAAWVPADRWYLRAAGLDRVLRLADEADGWLTHFVRNLAESSQDAHVLERTLLRLGLSRRSLEAGDLPGAVAQAVLLGPDPFFREGTAVCAILEGKDGTAAIEAALDRAWQATAPGVIGAAPREAKEDGVVLKGLGAPDRTIDAWRFAADGRVVLCDSRVLLREVLAARARRTPSIADAPDFRYMRTVLPSDADEDAFLYLSDAHVRHLVGPALKLGERRRLGCASVLALEDNAIDLFRMEQRRYPKDRAELVAGGFLPDVPESCPAGGKHAIDPVANVATCAVHGRLGSLAPVLDVPLDKVSEDEAEDYRRFVAEYNDYWRQYFDPIGVRLSLKQGLTVDTVILPLVNHSIYNALVQWTGGNAVPVGTLRAPRGTVMSVQAAFDRGPKGLLHELADEYTRHEGLLPPDALDLVGGEVAVGLQDRELLFDFDVHEFLGLVVGQGGRFGSDLAVAFPIVAALNLPTWVAFSVTDTKKALELADRIRAILLSRSEDDRHRRTRMGSPFVEVDAYDLPDYEGLPVHVVAVKLLGLVKLRAFYSAFDGRLWIASRESLLRDAIDARGTAPAAPEDAATLRLRVDMKAFARILPDVFLSWAEHARRACAANLSSVWSAWLASGQPDDLGKARVWALGRRGAFPVCPDGGAYRLDANLGGIACTEHGHTFAGRQGQTPDVLPRASKFLERLGAATVDLTFTPEGLRTRIRLDYPPPK